MEVASELMMDLGVEVVWQCRYELAFVAVFMASWVFVSGLRTRIKVGVQRSRQKEGFEPGPVKEPPSPITYAVRAAEQREGRHSVRDGAEKKAGKKPQAPVASTQSSSRRTPGAPNENSEPRESKGSRAREAETAATMVARFASDPEKLCAAITKASLHKYGQAMDIYRLAEKRELLSLEKGVSVSSLEQVFSNLILASIRVGKVESAVELLRQMRARGVPVNAELLSSVVKMCTQKHHFAEALQVRELCKEEFEKVEDQAVWSCLLFCAVDAPAHERCGELFQRIQSLGVPSVKDYWNLIRVAATRSDWERALSEIAEMRKAGVTPDVVIYNTAISVCVQARQLEQAEKLLAEMESPKDSAGKDKVPCSADVISYNTLMKGYAQAGAVDKCFALHAKMIERKIQASQVTFGILLDTCINENAMEKATKVFERMVESGCQMNTVLYTTLIKGFARANQVGKAMEVYEQMRAQREVSPDLVTYSILIKANCDAGKMEASLELLEDMLKSGYQPDEIVYNNLLGGCAKAQNGATLARKLFDDMLNTKKIPPSIATFSILIKVLGKGRTLGEAVELLEKIPKEYKLAPESRLYVQLAQGCIRERQGKRAVEVYKLLLGTPGCSSGGTVLGNILTACVTFNMYETALEVLEVAEEKKGHVSAQDANNLMEAMLKKKKNKFVPSVLGVMQRLGLELQPRLRPLVDRASKEVVTEESSSSKTTDC